VDVSPFKTLNVNPDRRTVVVGSGNNLGESYNNLSSDNQFLYPGVHALESGYLVSLYRKHIWSHLRKHVFSLDQAVEIQMINADAQIMKT